MRGRSIGVLALLLLAACGDDDTAAIVVELASTAAQTDDCDPSNQDVEPADITADNLHFILCSAGREPCWKDGRMIVSVQPVEPVDAAMAEKGIFVTRDLAFDADLRGRGPLRLEVVACEGGTATARGVVDDVRLGEQPLRIRLYAYDRVSCAGPRDRGGAPTYADPRAFHAMTALENGDVLVYGGVTAMGPVPDTNVTAVPAPNPEWTGMTLAHTVEVYRPSVERFLPVTVVGGPFLRAFFSSVVLSDIDGRARIRVFGGLTGASPDTPVIRFDDMQAYNAMGSPIVPHESALVGPNVDIEYDPASLTMTVEVVPLAVPRSAMNAVALAGSDPVVVPGLRAGAALPDGNAALDLSNTASWWNPSRGLAYAPSPELQSCLIPESDPLDCRGGTTGRWGHSVTPYGPTDVLVWGGNVFLMDVTAVDATAGEIISKTTRTSVAGGAAAGLPPPTAFHTATPISDGDTLLAGGLLVGCAGTPECTSGAGITTTRPPPEEALRILRRATVPSVSLTAAPVTGVAQSTIFHAATAVGDRSVVLTGGATAGFDGTGQIQHVADPQQDDTYEAGAFFAGGALIVPRWGHAAAVLPEKRILVTGGMRRVTPDRFEVVTTAEVIAFDEASFWDPCPALVGGTVRIPDAGIDGGVRLDAGLDSGAATDSGVAAMDAGL